jgi:hypothetical protein
MNKGQKLIEAITKQLNDLGHGYNDNPFYPLRDAILDRIWQLSDYDFDKIIDEKEKEELRK